MTFHTPNDRVRHEQWTDLGTQIDELEPQQTNLTNKIYELETSIHDARVRFQQIEQELNEISTMQALARGIGGRGGARGALAGEGFAQVVALARQKDELERERDRLRSELSGLDRKLEVAKRRLEEVNYLLSRLQPVFEQLGCGTAYRNYSSN